MIKNTLGRLAAAIGLAGLVLLGGCEPPPAHPGAFQGVVELDERILGFETGGRITAIAVQRGASVKDGDELATLDDSLARTAREAREAEVAAADARVALLKAGSRGEEIRAMSAELAAARAAEDLAVKEVNRARVLVESGAMAKASLDQAEAALASQKARREAVSERLRGLRNGPRKQEIESAEAQAKAAAKAVVLESEKLERHVLHAHGAGTVLDVHVDPGEIVADTGHPYVDIFVPEGNLDGIRVGSKAKIFVDATTDAFAGAVEDVGRRTEFTPRYLFSEKERPALVVRVRVRVDDPETRLHAGVPAFVEVDRSGAAAPSPSPSGTAEPTKVGEASR